MKANPETDNLSVFNEYANLVKEKYAMLDAKGVNIDHLKDSIGATIGDNLSEKELFDKLSIITLRLKDGHSDLSYGDEFVSYNFFENYPPGIDFDILMNHYLASSIAPNIKTIKGGEIGVKVVYGSLPQNNTIAYIWVPSWDIELTDEEVESVFKNINDKKALIFDMRYNTGGDPSLAVKFASYFTDKEVYTGFERFKTGPGKNDFSDSQINLIPSQSEYKFLKPVIVLTDRFCFSASTSFAYSVEPLENMTFMGQRTGGGSGAVTDGLLANGWHWSLSTSEFIDYKGRHLDNGFEPDIPVALDTLVKDKDEVIERALLELQ
jgi:hypothetical protein